MKKKLVYDIEVFPNLFTIVFIDQNTGKQTIFEKSNRKDNTKNLYKFVKGNTLIGYNNNYYDNPILNYFLLADPTNEEIYEFSSMIINPVGFNDYKKINKYKYTRMYKSIDLMSMLFSKALRVGLKELQATMKWHNLLESKIEFDSYVENKDIDEIIEYNINDVKSTLELFNTVVKDIQLRENIQDEFNIECMSKDPVNIGVSLMQKFISEKNNIPLKQLKDIRNHVNFVKLKDIINPFVEFRTPELKSLLKEIKNFVVIPKERYFGKRVSFKSSHCDKMYHFDVMNGGLHMVRPAGVVKPKSNQFYEQRDFGKNNCPLIV